MTRYHSWGLLVFAVIAIAAIIYLKSRQVRVKSESPPPAPVIDYGDLIRMRAEQSRRRNQNALKTFEMELNRVMAEHQTELKRVAKRATAEAADYQSCCYVIYCLALDKVKGGNRAGTYLSGQIKPYVAPAVAELNRDTQALLSKLDYELRESTVQLARDLAALCPDAASRPVQSVNESGTLDIKKALWNLGFNAAGIGVSAGLDVVAFTRSQSAAPIWRRLTALVARMFGKQAAKVTASVGAAAVDGPLLIGDVVAILGTIWTAHDIYATQARFERELRTALDNELTKIAYQAHRQAIANATAMLKQYQKLQDQIGTETLAQAIHRSN